MLRLHRYILALVIWLAFLFNIERLDVDIGFRGPEISNLATPVYFAAMALALIGIVLPQWKRVPFWQLNVLAVLAFIAARIGWDRPIWGGSNTFISLFECASCMITVTLAGMIGRLSADFTETVRSILFSDMDSRVYSMESAEPLLKREMQYARRTNNPMSVMLIDATVEGAPIKLSETAVEIQRLLAKRHGLVALTRLLTRTLRRTDLVLDQTESGRLVLVLPTLQREQAAAIFNRINDRVQRRLGIQLRYGISSFPQQGVTFEELVYQAEQELQPVENERRTGSRNGEVTLESEPVAIAEPAMQVSVDRSR